MMTVDEITDYEIMCSDTKEGLENDVKLKIESGWIPNGSFGIKYNGVFYQAIVKKEN